MGIMKAYAHENFFKAGFGSDAIQFDIMKTCRDIVYITSFAGTAGDSLLSTYLNEIN
jgi:hypothetical protein